MSKPTRGPDELGGPAVRRGDWRGGWGGRGPWTAARGLGVAAGALVLVSLVSPALSHSGAQAAVAGSAAGAPRSSGAPASSASPLTGAATAPTSTGTTQAASTSDASAGAVPTSGAGTTHVLAVPGSDTGATGRTVRYTVEVEDGAGVDEAAYAHIVHDVLTDKRGWETEDKVHFINVSPEQAASGVEPDVRITLASPATVDKMCYPMTTEGQVSCNNGQRVALNSVRWTQGVPYFPDDLLHYRIYMVNHEVGHAIGHGHESCAGPGKAAPVMLQQTLGLQGCTRYPWPVPDQTP